MDREDVIRKRVLDIYSKTEDDFANPEEWHDYEEERETIIENLVEGKDVAQTEARIAQYQHDNRARELRRTVAALNERQGAGLEGVSAEQAAAHAGTVDGNGAEEDAGVIEEIQRLVEETPAEEAERLARIAGGWDERLAKRKAEEVFLCSIFG